MIQDKVEIMAPVGSFESLHAAIDAGANSVYFGVSQLNMRARSAANFDLDDLAEICRIAKNHNIRTYLTVNTLLYQHDMNMMHLLVNSAKEHGVSAVICADMAAILYANSIDQPVHISTQLSVSNLEAVKFYAKYAETVVLARELDLNMIKEICDGIRKEQIMGTIGGKSTGKLLEIEIFVHGALCIAQSGRCTMSLFTDNSSANRGACKQTCRRAYKLTDLESGEELKMESNYVMSPADLCSIDFMDKLLDTGISVLKIEGRGRSGDYVHKVARAYREAADAVINNTYTEDKVQGWFKDLKSVYNRGLSSGWYLGRPIPELSHSYGSKATEEKIYVGRISKYYPKAEVAEMTTEAAEVTSADKIVILGPETGIVEGDLSSLRDDDGNEISKAPKKTIITFKVDKPVKKKDKLYLLKKRGNI